MECDDHKGYYRKDIHSILVSFWSTRASILLSARSVFIAIETVIFSVGVYLASLETRGTNILLMLVVCGLGIALAVLWFLVCVNLRCKEHYFRWRILQFEKAKYSSEKVWGDFINFLRENREKKRYELFWDHEWKQSGTKWFPGGVLNTGLPWVFIGLFIVLIMIFTLSN